ncbi:MAG: class I SAM-dependent methyltransferase, partial [Syntrophobacteraceae bacterium]
RESLVKKDLLYIKSHRDFISNLYGGLIVQERLESLIHFMNKDWRLSDLLDFCCITYLAPSDAKTTTLISNSIDLVTSFTVLEHIPPSELKLIIAEMDRILKRTSGLHVHRIDYTDHFAHSDKSISPINFLRYSADEWNKIAGNQFMYMNRLRHHDYLSIFNENHHIVFDEPEVSSEVRTILPDFPLHEDFAFKSFSDLSTTAAWVTVLTN